MPGLKSEEEKAPLLDCSFVCTACRDWREYKDHCAIGYHHEVCRYCKGERAYEHEENLRNAC